MSDASDQRSSYDPTTPTPTSPTPTTLGPWTAYTLSSCVFTLSAYSMGAQWLATPVLGLPLGVLGIGAGFGVLALTRRAAATAPSLSLSGFSGVAASASEFFGRLRRAGADKAKSSTTASSRSDGERRSGAVVIRVGLDLPADERELILDAASRFTAHEGVRFEWVTINSGASAIEPTSAPRARRWSDRLRSCDATLRRTSGGGGGSKGKSTLEITTMQHTQGSAWIDWGRPEEFSYAGCFPTRLDPALVSLGGARVEHDCAPALARLAAAAAAFRRTATFGASGGVGLNASPAERAADDMILEALRWAAGSGADDRHAGNSGSSAPIRRVAARIGAAWAVGRGLAVPPGERVRLVNNAGALLSREPQLVLQSLASSVAAAAAAGGGADSSGVDEAMTEAVERLLRLDVRATVDPFPFVMSELEHGLGDALTLGRVAAGAAMLWSGAHGGSMKFLREDLLSDIEHTGWLQQRPPMRALLTRLVRGADRARNDWDQQESGRRAA